MIAQSVKKNKIENKKITVITGTRAEYGLLRPLLFRLKQSKIHLDLVVTGSHLHEALGNTQSEIKADGFLDYISMPLPLEGDDSAAMAMATGVIMQEFAQYLQRARPDLVILLGDRYEIFGAASAAHIMGIPIAHISGGDVTEGAIDDALRHSITKMSYLHFAGSEQSAKRIIQMGEEPERVFNVGELGVENCLNLKLLSREELAQALNFKGIEKSYAVVTFHPVTLEADAESQLYQLIAAMDQFPDLYYVITLANADAGGRKINEIWQNEAQSRANWYVVSSLGVLRYLSALKYAALVLGNSSSGILEAPSFKVPTVNIGNRQKGRPRAKSVVDVETQKDRISQAMQTVLKSEFYTNIEDMDSPFGDGKTSELIMNRILEFLRIKKPNYKKSFYDLPNL